MKRGPEVPKHPAPLEPALDFLQRLWALNHGLERASLRMERQLGVTAQQRLFIRCIGKYPDMAARDLALVLHLDHGTVSVSLRRLEKKRLITRHRDRSDSRRVSLRLTARGKALDKPHAMSVEAAVSRLLRRTRSKDVATTKRLLDRLTHELEWPG